MKSAFRQFAIILLLIIAMALGLFLLFHYVYEPELVLRAQLRHDAPEPEELERLIELAAEDRLDLTDTLQLADMLQRLNRIESELALFQRLEARYPNNAAIRLWYADRLRQYGKWSDADSEYMALLELMQRQDSAQPRNKYRFWRARDKDIIMAGRVTKLADRFAPVPIDELFRKLAENAMSAGRATTGAHCQVWLEKSQSFFIRSLESNPENQDTRGAYANLLLQLSRPDESLSQYRQLLETDPDNSGWLVSASLAAAAGHRFDEAERYIRRALNKENRPAWRLELARIMSWGGKHDAALGEIDALIEESPNYIVYRRERAAFLLNADRRKEYLAETARLAAANPLDFELRVNRASAMLGMESYDAAVNEASAILALDPGNYEAAFLKAQALLWMGDYRAAQEAWQALALREPNNRLVRKRVGQSFLWGKQYTDALIVLRKLNPATMEDAELAQAFAEAVAAQETPPPEDSATIRAMRQEMTRLPERTWPTVLLAAMGRALRAIGEKDKAVEMLRAATLQAETNLKLRLELADLLQDIGLREEADREYRKITHTKSEDISK